MPKNILLIVEGSVDEQNIFGDVFSKYGFNTIISDEKMDVEGVGQFEKSINDVRPLFVTLKSCVN